jgi:dipeptidyl aminopeptidase/acylaminoacyl peptidase
MKITKLLPLVLAGCLINLLAVAQKDLKYQTPPAAIADLVTAPLTPLVSVNAGGDWMLLLERPGYPSIEELAQPELRIAGLRINPRTNGPSRSSSYNGLMLKNIETGESHPVEGLPENPRIENVNWSPDGQHLAFSITRPGGLELWVADASTKRARRLTDARLNDAMRGTPYDWFPDNKTILAKLTVEDRGEPPTEPLTPEGPVVQETTGEKAPVRTYQDLLKDPHDEALFEYYATGQLVTIDVESGQQTPFGDAGIVSESSISPDGHYVLLGAIHRPFSYLVPYSRFPVTYEILDRQGNLVKEIADIPLAENIPKGFGAVREGPRSFTWRNDRPATLYWVEAQDGGDPSVETDLRDRLFYLEAPFDGEAKAGITFRLRYGGLTWGDDELAIAYEWWWTTRQQITSRFDPKVKDSKEVLFDLSFEDRYNDPGNFVTKDNEYGRSVLLTAGDDQTLYLTGTGASPEGNRPFLRAFDLATKETEELWRSQAPYYEYPVRVLDPRTGSLITRRESKEEPPNYFLRHWKKDELEALTEFEHPYPALKGIEKQVIKYKRKDGVDLQGDLYLPKGYDPERDGPLPVLTWAYPNEYKSAQAASQVEGSPYEFIRLYWGSPLYWLTQGYAIFDDISMPVIGEGDEEPNDNFREQLVANAEAAIDKLVEMGIADRNRVAIGGHSYGAFMTANLLAHSDLFAAGIARSGAYNRTLTPFGFQSEERTYWEAPEVYYSMSPFMHADKVNEPILLIHGQADNNSGTFPIQSERFYAAIKGLGGTARLVMLPYESHGYRARESILHMLWEQNQWLDKYVKNRKEAQP